MQQYKQTLQYVKDHGNMRGDRTGKGRHGVFSPPDEIYDLSQGFPLTTLREVKPEAMVDELLWFISGSTSIEELKYKFFWKKWTTNQEDAIKYANDVLGIVCDTPEEYMAAIPDEVIERIGKIGNLYGVSWRNAPAPKGIKLPERSPDQVPREVVESIIPVDHDGKKLFSYESILEFLKRKDTEGILFESQEAIRHAIHNAYWSNYDQLNELIYKLKNNPNSSRLRVTAYITDYMAFEEFSPQENVMDGRAALTACHTFFQCFVNPGKDGGKAKLDLKLTLTSSDVPVGRVYNIAQYALLCSMLAHVCDMDAGRLIISTGDAHIYGDQFEAVDTILSRDPLPMPKLWLNPKVKDLFAFTAEDIKILDYKAHPAVDVPVAV